MQPIRASRTDIVTMRPARRSDVAPIAALYARLSEASFSTRFMQVRADRPLRPLAEFDPDRGDVVLLASLVTQPDLPIGEARYVPTGNDVAEFALTIDDGVQGRGIGGALFTRLVQTAHRRGVARLSGTVLTDNLAMLRLLDRFDWVVAQECDYGVVNLEVSTSGGLPPWPADAQRRILVEGRGWYDTPEVARLRAEGATVRRCPGPRSASFGGVRSYHETCPLVMSGRCLLAEQADEIIDLLPAGVEVCDAVLDEHRRRWPQRVRTAAGYG